MSRVKNVGITLRRTAAAAHLGSRLGCSMPTPSCYTALTPPMLAQMRCLSTSHHPKIQLTRFTSEDVDITLNDRPTKFQAKWLWYNCSRHHDRDSGQRFLAPFAVCSAPSIEAARVDKNTLFVVWTDGTSSEYPVNWLVENDYSEHRLRELHRKAAPAPLKRASATDKHISDKEVAKVSFNDVVHDEKALYQLLHRVNTDGLALVTDAPLRDRTVLKVASRISHPMWTIYGEVWDVAVMPHPINIAYSPISLDLHVDLVYYESPPGLQLLHCRQFDDGVVGGESTFIDGFAVAEEFRRRHPDHFNTFLTIPATFQKVHYKRASPAHIQVQRPHITVDPASGDITGVFWAPPFEGPLRVASNSVEAYFAAYRAFSDVLHEMQEGEHLIEFRMQPGMISVFNNRRMLHGRRHFFAKDGSENAQRVLQGCYVNIDEYKSKCHVLSSVYGEADEVKRVGNQNWY